MHRCIFVSIILVLTNLVAARAAEFLPIVDSRMGNEHVQPRAVANNGVVAGNTRSAIVNGFGVANNDEAFRWTPDEGMQYLGFLRTSINLPYDLPESRVVGMTADGTKLLGVDVRGQSSTRVGIPFLWSEGEGMIELDISQSDFSPGGISSDGTIITGTIQDGHAVIWTASNGVTSLGTLPGDTYSRTYLGNEAMSADGTHVLGWSRPSFTKPRREFLWTSESGMRELPSPPGAVVTVGSVGWVVTDLSVDGSVIIGSIGGAPRDRKALMWHDDALDEPIELETPSGWGSIAQAIAGDGSRVYGRLYPASGAGDNFSVVWSANSGFVPLNDLLANDYGLGAEVTGWDLFDIRDTSDNGRFVVGRGRNPQGNLQSFLIDFGPPKSIPGDYNGNGRVEQADLDLVLLNWNTTNVPADWAQELPSGVIDQAELDGVLLNWGNTSAATFTSSAAVPEPGTVVLLTTCLAGLAIAGRQAAQRRHSASRAA